MSGVSGKPKGMLSAPKVRRFPSASRNIPGSNVFEEWQRPRSLVIVLVETHVRDSVSRNCLADGLTSYRPKR